MRRLLYHWHPLIGMMVAVPILLWGLSGLTHPLMRLLRPPINEAALTQTAFIPSDFSSMPTTVLAGAGITSVVDLQALHIGSRTAWRALLLDGNQRYIDAATGQLDDTLGRQFAEQAARAYSNEKIAPIRSLRLVSTFDDEYGFINKILSVWRVEFVRPDHLRLFIATDNGQFISAVDDTRYTLTTIFGLLHTWNFLDSKNPWRIALTVFFMSLLIIIGVTGMTLYALGWRARNRVPLRGWHRGIGLSVSFATLMFGVSGALHILEKLRTIEPSAEIPKQVISLAMLNIAPDRILAASSLPVTAVNLGMIDGVPAWRLSHHVSEQGSTLMNQHDHGAHTQKNIAHATDQVSWPASWVRAADAAIIKEGEARRARELAGLMRLDVAVISAVNPVIRFSHDYDFINKRLPVVRVDLNDEYQSRYFIDAANGKLISHADNRFNFEEWTFRNLHKWHFADGLGLNGRDTLIALFVSGNFITVGLGAVLLYRRRKLIENK